MTSHSEANRQAFDHLASSYNSKPWQIGLSSQVSDALRSHLTWLGLPTPAPGRDIKLLDYACGPGSITTALSPYVTQTVALDVSPNMVEAYNAAATACGANAKATVGDLVAENVAPDFEGEEWKDFDVAVIGLGFHHFADPALAVKRLTERLKPGTGVLVIVDFLPFAPKEHQHHSHSGPDMQTTIKHHGFTSTGLESLFTSSGLEDFGFQTLPEPAKLEFADGGTSERTVFIAKGKRAPTVAGKLWRFIGGFQDAVSGQMGLKPDGTAGEWKAGFRKDGGDGSGSRMVGTKDEGTAGGMFRRDEPVGKE
ncbi:hypothetical protein B0A48_11832 [Cryoendolithus antarcticus]|uniref:Methyltransferase domain-containing protein n=1 Tax=Cryoendolithus antarcticus TaxID=1507870 RepID=A0A1V8STE6_9PEZI|nr:hypothetical protein B0A48_11832 [Cryoendolithus antarcticus]